MDSISQVQSKENERMAIFDQSEFEAIAMEVGQYKQLSIFDLKETFQRYGDILFAREQNQSQEYAIKIIPLQESNKSRSNEIYHIELKQAQSLGNLLNSCNNHPHVLKWYDQFQIGTNYFIQMERFQMSLYEWFQIQINVTLSSQMIVDYSVQILSIIKQLLQHHNLLLTQFSLKSLFIDKQYNIKLYQLTSVNLFNSIFNSDYFLNSHIKGVNEFFFPPTLQKLYQMNLTKMNIANQNQSIEVLGNICIDDTDINALLFKILEDNPKPRKIIKNIIQQFQYLSLLYDIFDILQNSQLYQEKSNHNYTDLENLSDSDYQYSNTQPENENYIHQITTAANLLEQVEVNREQNSRKLATYSYEDNQKEKQYKIKNNNNNNNNNNINQNEMAYYERIKQNYQGQMIQQLNSLLDTKQQQENRVYLRMISKMYLEVGLTNACIQWSNACLKHNPRCEQSLIITANAYEKKRQDSKAVCFYKKALKVNGNNEESLYKIGQMKYKMQQYDEALGELRETVQRYPNNYRAMYYIGKCSIHLRKYGDAIYSFTQVIQLQPNNYLPYQRLAEVFYTLQLYDQAIIHLHQALRKQPAQKEIYIIIGSIYEDKQMTDVANVYFKQATSITSNKSDSFISLASNYIELQLYDLALFFLDKADKLNPKNSKIQVLLGKAYLCLDMTEKAIQHFQMALEITPKYIVALRNLGQAYSLRYQYNKAISCYRQILKISNRYRQIVYFNIGYLYYYRKYYHQSCYYLQLSLAIPPHQLDLHLLPEDIDLKEEEEEEGQDKEEIDLDEEEIDLEEEEVLEILVDAYFIRKRYDECLYYYQRLVEKQADCEEMQYRIGIVYVKKGMKEKAVSCFKAALQMDQLNFAIYVQLGNIYAEQQLAQTALKHYKYAISIQPDEHSIYYHLGNFYKDRHMYEDSHIQYRISLNQNEENHKAFNALGELKCIQSKYKLAISYFKKALAIQPKCIKTLFNLANAFYLLQNYASAIICYKQISKLQPNSNLLATNIKLTNLQL